MNVLDSFSLRGKTALMTGGAGLYGQQIVEALAEAGAETYIASRDVAALETVAAAHRAKGEDVTALQFDQGDEASILALRDTVIQRSGKLDILVNNAVLRTMRSFDDPAENFALSMKVNATGLFLITRACGDAMAARGGGRIVNIGSIQGMVGPDAEIYQGTGWNGYIPDYFFHKGGMINFTRFAASHYGPKGVTCNCVSPGGLHMDSTPERFDANYSARTFLGRMAGATDLKGAIVFLASDASAYVTGGQPPGRRRLHREMKVVASLC